jgi:hypothetical protein
MEGDLLGLGVGNQGQSPLQMPPPPPSKPAPIQAPIAEATTDEDKPSASASNNASTSPVATSATVLQPSASSSSSSSSSGGGGGLKCIVVPQRIVNGGFDFKFEEDPMHVKLGGIIKADDFVVAICAINDALKQCRATRLDHTLLLMGPAMLPLIPWAIRHKEQRTQRRKIMQRAVQHFNLTNELNLVMRWQSRPAKELTIWRKADAEAEANK